MLIVNVQKVSSGLTDTFCFRANEIKVCYSRRRPVFCCSPHFAGAKRSKLATLLQDVSFLLVQNSGPFPPGESGKLSVLGFDKVMLNFAAPRLSRPRQFCEVARKCWRK